MKVWCVMDLTTAVTEVMNHLIAVSTPDVGKCCHSLGLSTQE